MFFIKKYSKTSLCSEGWYLWSSATLRVVAQLLMRVRCSLPGGIWTPEVTLLFHIPGISGLHRLLAIPGSPGSPPLSKGQSSPLGVPSPKGAWNQSRDCSFRERGETLVSAAPVRPWLLQGS